jgi:hypothetical protein
MVLFGLGMLVGGLLTLVLLALLLRLTNGVQALPSSGARSALPELSVTLSRELLTRLIDDSLQDVALPLVSLRDPQIELEPNAVLVVRLRGDTVLLGAQAIVLRTRLVPAVSGVRVVTESAEVGVLGNIAGPLTARLDAQINAELARRLAFAEQFEVLEVSGNSTEVVVNAQLKE